MPDQQNKLLQFWNELKRRNVIRVITVYAATAFVIIEMVDILAPSLGLPSWTLNLVLILLFVGLVIAVVVSWIYDFHPLGGIVKTEPAEKRSKEDIRRFSNSWKIASMISFIIIAGLVILNVFPRSGKRKVIDKSIAVLPFINDSPEEDGMYFINGSMESILNNLSRIQDLRVVSRTSVEQYRNNLKPVGEIAQEMNVAYILEGSGLRHGDQIRLNLELIDATHDTHVWSNSYDRNEEEVFELYSDVAQMVASEIEAIITPEEQKRIEKIPTKSTTAYDLYQKAGEVGEDESVDLLHYALDYDSTFALPYISLGSIYLDKYSFNRELYSSYLDSTIRMVDKALQFDPQSAEAQSLKGYQLRQEGNIREALLSFDRALQLNPNLANAYNGKGWIYFGEMDYVNALENFYQNIIRDRTQANLIANYRSIGFVLTNLGFREQAILSYEKSLQYGWDSIRFLIRRAQLEFYTGNFQDAINIALPGNENIWINDLDEQSNHVYGLAVLGECNMYLGRYEESYKYYKKYLEISDSAKWPLPYQKMNIAFIFSETGHMDRVRELIDQQIRQSDQWIADNRGNNNAHYQYLAMAYMLSHDKANALLYLKFLSQQKRMNAPAALIPENPIYREIRNDPEFIGITSRIRSRYLEDQDQVRQWLMEHVL